MSRVHTVPISYGPGCHLRKGSTVTQVHHTSAQTAVGQVHRLFIAIPHVQPISATCLGDLMPLQMDGRRLQKHLMMAGACGPDLCCTLCATPAPAGPCHRVAYEERCHATGAHAHPHRLLQLAHQQVEDWVGCAALVLDSNGYEGQTSSI
eukprot:574613-Pelagomonas_calceolata.AAC.4